MEHEDEGRRYPRAVDLDASAPNHELLVDLFTREFGKLVQSVERLVGRCTHDGFDAEDAVQEAFSDTFEGIRAGRFRVQRSRGDLRAYVLSAARNKAIDSMRRVAAEMRGGGRVVRFADATKGSGAAQELSVAAGATTDPVANACYHELRATFAAALAGLDDPYRDALLLVVEVGLTPIEIAEREALASPSTREPVRSPGHVRLVLFRARERLREALPIPA
jgi:RNA polymerase sigma factor (sigma-70 family)